MKVFDTRRLSVRQLELSDAVFVLRLLNEPSWIANIGDKNVHSLPDAREYLQDSTFQMYRHYGFGLFLVENKNSSEAMGLCGLIQRKGLLDVDLGFAFLPQFWGQGYACEAAQGTIDYARREHRLQRIVAITLPSNWPCIKLLTRLGFVYEQNVQLLDDPEQLRLYAISL